MDDKLMQTIRAVYDVASRAKDPGYWQTIYTWHIGALLEILDAKPINPDCTVSALLNRALFGQEVADLHAAASLFRRAYGLLGTPKSCDCPIDVLITLGCQYGGR